MSRSDKAAARAFADLIAEMGCRSATRSPRLRNLTFWAGAGFSRAWEAASPTGTELFTLELSALEDIVTPLALRRLFGVDPTASLTPAALRQIVYFLDMNEKYPEVSGRYYDRDSIRRLRAALRAVVQRNFETRCTVNFLEDGARRFPAGPLRPEQEAILAFFTCLKGQVEFCTGLARGLRTHFLTTNYDFVIETILDRVGDDGSGMFETLYRGFTPQRILGQIEAKPVTEHWLARNLLKLNGGFEIVPRGDGYELDYHRRSTQALVAAPPVIMLPSREQDYSDPYFRSVFPKAVRLMRESDILVLVGYSLSEDDALIRFILRQFAEDGEDAVGKHVFYIDINAREHRRRLLGELFPYVSDCGVPHFHLFSGGFAEFAAACLPLIGAEGAHLTL
jgi:SIR2-like domain